MGRLVSAFRAQRMRQWLRQQGKTVVFTNGVFDLLHVGHTRYLQAARQLGDYLFVGLNSDLSTQKLKGPGRPVIAQAERAELLCALACVDYVVIFDELTAEHLVETLQPDIYVKGGDYTGGVSEAPTAPGQAAKPLPEAPIVERYGGRVVILPYIPGRSTSEIVDRVLRTEHTQRRDTKPPAAPARPVAAPGRKRPPGAHPPDQEAGETAPTTTERPPSVGRGAVPPSVGRGAVSPSVGRGAVSPSVGRGAVSPSVGRGIAAAAMVVSLGNIASRILGLIRDNRNAYFFGATGSMSAFAAASLVPKNIYELLVGGMVSAALVPVFSEYAANRDPKELWHLVSVVLSLVVVIMGGFLVLAEVAAPLLTRTLVGGFSAELQALTSTLIRVIAPAIIFFGVSGILTAVLYAQQVFTYPAIGAAVFNIGGILGTQLLARRIGIASLTLGIVFGAFLQMAVQFPGLRKARIRFSLDWKHPALRRITVLYVPVILSLVISQIGIVLDRNLASRVGEQAIAWMENATRLREFPLGLVSTAVSMAVLPALSRLDLRTGRKEFKATLGQGLRLILVLIIPAAVGLLVLGKPIIALIFQHGEFTPLDTNQVTRALFCYLLGTPFAAVDLLLIFAFYSQKDTVTPVLVGIVCVFIYLLSAPALAFWRGLGMIGLVLANSIQLTSHAVIMLLLLRRRVGSLAQERLMPTIFKSVLASAAMGASVYLALTLLQMAFPGGGTLNTAIWVAGAGLTGVLIYAVGLIGLRVGEVELLLGLLRRATGRTKHTAA